jgi:hypothetical protein
MGVRKMINEAMNAKMLEIQLILEDYSDVIYGDKETTNYVLDLVGRFYDTGVDINESELDLLILMLKKKVDEFVKSKGN